MIIRKEIDMSKPLTPEQIKMLEEMDKRPVVPDEDSPAYSKEELIRLKNELGITFIYVTVIFWKSF